MDKLGLLWIKWVCNGYRGSVVDIVGLQGRGEGLGGLVKISSWGLF